MENRILIAGLILLGSIASAASANTSSSCISPNLQEGNKYQVSYSGKTERVKVLKITNNSCWVKVEAESSRSRDPIMAGTVSNKPFWINFNVVSSVK